MYSYGFSALVFIFALLNFKILNRYLILLIITIFFSALLNILYFSFPISSFAKNFTRFFIFSTAAYYVINKYSYEQVVEKYINVSYYVALIGIAQFLSLHLLGINFLNAIREGLTSVLAEPSHLAVALMPAVIMTNLQYKRYRIKAVVLLLALVGTFSLTAIAVLVVTIGITKLTWKGIFVIPFLAIIFFYAVNNNPLLERRVTNFWDVVITGKIDYSDLNYQQTHPTVLAWVSNLDVAIYSVSRNPIFGCGIGNHKYMYDLKYKGTDFVNHYYYGFGNAGAHCLSIRILSEMGLGSFFLYLFFLFKTYIRRKQSWYFHAISIGCISHFLCKSLKMASWVDYGTMMFVFLLYFNYKAFRAYRRDKRNLNYSKKISNSLT